MKGGANVKKICAFLLESYKAQDLYSDIHNRIIANGGKAVMDPISIARNTQMIDALNKTMTISNIKMTRMAEKLVKAAAGVNVTSKEMGKGENLDLLA